MAKLAFPETVLGIQQLRPRTFGQGLGVVARTPRYLRFVGNPPLGWQIIEDREVEDLIIAPGLFQDAGSSWNGNAGIRVYEGIFARDGMQANSYSLSGANPVWVQYAVSASVVPWNRKLNVFIEIVSSAIQSSSALAELIVASTGG